MDQSSGQIDATGDYAEIGYVLESRAWSPEIRFRRARFSGDDPTTALDERFRDRVRLDGLDLVVPRRDHGEYVLGNGNLESELVRLTLTPSERITFNAMYYRFTLDQPASFGATSADWGDELNFTVDWAATEQVSVTGVLGVLQPGDAAEQIVGGGSRWLHTMLLVSYSW